VTTENTTTTVEIGTNEFWPDEANLAAFAEQAEMADRLEQAEQPLTNDFEYAALYFVS